MSLGVQRGRHAYVATICCRRGMPSPLQGHLRLSLPRPQIGLPQGVAFEHDRITSALDLSFDGTLAVAGDDDGLLRVWDVYGGRCGGRGMAHVHVYAWGACGKSQPGPPASASTSLGAPWHAH